MQVHFKLIGAVADPLDMGKGMGKFSAFWWAFSTSALWGLGPVLKATDAVEWPQVESSPWAKMAPATLEPHREQLARLRGLYDLGLGLHRSCSTESDLRYNSPWERRQAERSVLATLQYMGLGIAQRALANYAREFQFTLGEYRALVDNLVGNSCSQNISSISLKLLRRQMLEQFARTTRPSFPNIAGNPFFPAPVGHLDSEQNMRRREMAWTLQVFQSLCSWGGDAEDLRLLVPLVRNPVSMAFLFRYMAGQKIAWDSRAQRTVTTANPDATPVVCRDIICRPHNLISARQHMPRAANSHHLLGDLNHLYCQEWRDADYNHRHPVPQIAQKIKNFSLDQQNFTLGQWLALITEVPDFLLQVGRFKDLQKALRSNADRAWERWVQERSQALQANLLYEESLHFDLVERQLHFDPREAQWRVEVDVNMGEWDRASARLGKLSTPLYLKVSRPFLSWARFLWRDFGQIRRGDNPTAHRVVRQFKAITADQFAEFERAFPLLPWSNSVRELVLREILEQISLYRGPSLKNTPATHHIPVHFNYGLFALKYLHRKSSLLKTRQK